MNDLIHELKQNLCPEKSEFQLQMERDFVDFVNTRRWRFAKTYAKFCPHEYVIKQWYEEEEQKRFVEIAKFIKEYGWYAVYGSCPSRKYYAIGDFYYWNMDEPELTSVLNRARFDDYEFARNMFGEIKMISCWKGGRKIL